MGMLAFSLHSDANAERQGSGLLFACVCVCVHGRCGLFAEIEKCFEGIFGVSDATAWDRTQLSNLNMHVVFVRVHQS